METSKILSADFLDLLFDGKNKDYGAYDLRKTYRKRITYAMAATFFICLLLTVGSIIANGTDQKKNELFVKDFELERAPDEKKPEPPPPPPPPKQEIPKVEITTFTPPKIVPEDQVKPEDEIKDVETLDQTKIGTINQEGVKDDGLIAPPIEKVTGPEAPLKVDEDYEKEIAIVQYAAEFPGGQGGWNKYLERYLNSNIPIDNGAPQGKYTVIISFVVNKTGDISDVTAENDPGYGTKAEAIRVISKGPKWKPAMQNGRNVIHRQKQSVSFIVSEQ